jgi:L-alanine-DL-glutamate epimerase-like enolase superfamily enzyme
MLTEIAYDGMVGYGEASMPPYLGENHDTATRFLQSLKLDQFKAPFQLEDILSYVDEIAEGNCAAKASIDIALHDLIGRMKDQPYYKIWGFNPKDAPDTSFTIGIDTPQVIKQKLKEAAGFKILKIKLGLDNDKEIIETIRSMTNVPICVDANQGWKDKQQALDMTHWLKAKGVIFIEQPMPKKALEETAWLSQNSPLPIIADEAVQRLNDLKKIKGVYSGINIKLMKCTGMREAHKMITLARELDMKVMIGCMTETSCGISAAAQLSPKADWADLDGNLLISNDPFIGVKVKDGKVILLNKPGIGVKKRT